MLKRHFRNASWGWFSAAFRAAYGLLNVLLTIRLLGVETYGHVATVLAFFVFYASLNSSIFTILVVKLMATENDSNAVTTKAAPMAGMLFVAVSLALLAFAVTVVERLAPADWLLGAGLKELLLTFAVLTAIQILTGFQAALIEGAGRMDRATKAQLFGPMLILASLFLAFTLKLQVTALSYAGILCIGALMDLCLTWFAGRKTLPSTGPFAWTSDAWVNMWALLRSGSLLQATSLMNMFLEPLNKLLLNNFLGASAVTFYDLGTKLIWGIQSLFSAAMRVFLHMASQEQEMLGNAYSSVVRVICVPVVLLHVVGALFLAIIARYWLKTDALDLLVFFAVATLSNLGMILVTPLYNALIGNEDLGFIFKIQARLALINIVASFALIPILGLVGAAFGLLIATVYNAAVIIARSKPLLNADHPPAQFARVMVLRLLAAGLLLILALLWGFCGSDNPIALIIICVGILGMTFHEPAVVMLFKERRIQVRSATRLSD